MEKLDVPPSKQVAFSLPPVDVLLFECLKLMPLLNGYKE